MGVRAIETAFILRTMRLYDRFQAPGEDVPVSAGAQDTLLECKVTLWQTPVAGGHMGPTLAKASRVFAGWEKRHSSAEGKVELFSSPGHLWLAAQDEGTVAGLLDELRAAGMFVARPDPLPPDTRVPAPALSETPRPGATATGKVATAPVGKPHGLGGFFLAAALVLAAPLAWFGLRHLPSTPPAGPVQIVSFKANRTQVRRGGAVVLSWQSSGVASLSIQPDIGDVPASGSRTVRVYANTTYLLRSTAPGNRILDSVSILVGAPARPLASGPGHTGGLRPASSGEASEIAGALDVWTWSIQSNNAALLAALYAPRVERYFLQTNWSNAQIQNYLTRFFSETAQYSNFSDSNPEITFDSAGDAHVSLQKHFTLKLKNTGEEQTKDVRSELHLRKFDGSWKITFERDFKN